MVGHLLLFHPAMRKIGKLIESGKIASSNICTAIG